MPHLILASASPRRQELIRRLVSSYSQAVSEVEETGSNLLPGWEIEPLPLSEPFKVQVEADPRLWAWRKGVDALSMLPESEIDGSIVLAADTVVVAPGELLGKPLDRSDAVRMLTILRGRPHYVVTGFVLLRSQGNAPETLHARAIMTRVFMRSFSDSELKGYVATGEQSDKAGAYALQGLGGRLVERVDGCVTNVIGLPLCAVRSALLSAGVDVLPAPEQGYCNFCEQLPFAGKR
jgi:septum formation protein